MIPHFFRITFTLKERSILSGLLSLPLALSSWCGAQTSAASNWKPVEEAMGRPGQVQPGDVIRFGMPRKDLHVTLGDVAIKAGLALGSWAAFVQTEHGAMVMGDLVLTEDELGPVMRKLQEGGIEISAVHNHLIYGYTAGLGIDVNLIGGLFLRAEWEYVRFTAATDTNINTVRAGLGYKF